MREAIRRSLENLREKEPLIHNITNYVTVNDCANILLACGAAPIMADDPAEAEEITAICSGLNINIGTLDKRTIPSMIGAGLRSNAMGHPVLLDPVGVGASSFRTKTANTLLEKIHFSVIKGNISEIKTLAKGRGSTKGVDAEREDRITEKNLMDNIEFLKGYAKALDTIVIVTGEKDIITDGINTYLVSNGHPMMAKVTGTGCMLSAMTTAFIAANPRNPLEAATGAVVAMGLAGELGYEKIKTLGQGNASYRNHIIDSIYLMKGEMLADKAKVILYE